MVALGYQSQELRIRSVARVIFQSGQCINGLLYSAVSRPYCDILIFKIYCNRERFSYTQKINFGLEAIVRRENRERSEQKILIDIYIRDVACMTFKFFWKTEVYSGEQPPVAFFPFFQTPSLLMEHL